MLLQKLSESEGILAVAVKKSDESKTSITTSYFMISIYCNIHDGSEDKRLIEANREGKVNKNLLEGKLKWIS